MIITAAIAGQLKPAMNAVGGEGTDCQASPTVREDMYTTKRFEKWKIRGGREGGREGGETVSCRRGRRKEGEVELSRGKGVNR